MDAADDANLGRAWRRVLDAVPEAELATVTVSHNAPDAWLAHASFGMAAEDDFEAFAPTLVEALERLDAMIFEHRSENPDCPAHTLRAPEMSPDANPRRT